LEVSVRRSSFALFAALAITAVLTADARQQKLKHPQTMKGDVVDDYHGTKVPDPYRWMEDLESKEVKAWVEAQNALTFGYLKGLPIRDHFQARITELWDYPKTSLPTLEGGRIFYRKNSGLQRQAPLYMRASLTAESTLLIDPNAISPDGSTSLSSYSPAPDGVHLAYTLSEGGADWQTVHVRHIASGKDLPDRVEWMRFSNLSWTKDGKGFFYSRYPEPPKGRVFEAALSGHALYYHRLGTPQSEDVLVYERKDLPHWFVGGGVSEDGRYLLVITSEGAINRNRLYFADLGDPKQPKIPAPDMLRPVVEADDAEYWPVGNIGSLLLLRSDKDAPNRKILGIDLVNPAPSAWKTVVAEQKQPLESAAFIGGRIVAEYLADVQGRLVLYTREGKQEGEIDLPGVGTIAGLSGREDQPTIFFSFTSPLYPTTVYAYDPASKRRTPFEAAKPPVDVGQYETTRHFATSKDGTRVPYFVTGRRGIARDGQNPAMLYAYGGFSVTTAPVYRADVPAWLELGGLWVTASLRGGAEYGEAWHKAGMLEKKQNVFDDFVAVAEDLVRQKYTSPARLAIMGGSNGGLLVGAAMQQRPDLFAVAVPAVGVMDMLRYDRFTGGRAWVAEYGSASEPEQFNYLIRYSPLHNVTPGTCYPATLVTTADHDDRVVPSHSYKFAAATQAAQGCDKPILIRVETQASHGYQPTDKRIAELADMWAFTAVQAGVPAPRGIPGSR
jgi:prolyl oligopeptidase